MNATLLAVCIMGPPAVYGIACALEDLTWAWQQHRRPADRLAARDRHPSRSVPPEDRPEWGRL